MIDHLFSCGPHGRLKATERREQILHTAIRLFSQRGFSGTTTKQIAQAAGVSEAMVFRHFATKDELYAAIIHSKACIDGLTILPWEQNENILAAMKAKDDHRLFYEFGLESMTKHQSDADFIRLLLFSALEEHDISKYFFNEFAGKVYEFLSEYIRTRQEDGDFKPVDPRIVVRILLGTWIHHSLNIILWDTDRKLLNISNEEAAKEFADVVLNGILIKK